MHIFVPKPMENKNKNFQALTFLYSTACVHSGASWIPDQTNRHSFISNLCQIVNSFKLHTVRTLSTGQPLVSK